MFRQKLQTLRSVFISFALLAALASACASSAHAAPEISPDLIRRVELQWEPQEKASGYELELGPTPEFNNNLYSEKLKDVKFNVDLLPGAYYYRVRALDEKGRPGRWTAVQELNINARPPVLQSPLNEEIIRGSLLDTGLPLVWRMSGPGIRYLVEIKTQDASGEFTQTVVKQEVTDTEFPFFPQEPGTYQWSVHTLGAGGDEPGTPWVFTVEGVIPPGVDVPPGTEPKRIVRFVPPWWRGHWTLYGRYGQASLGYSIIDQDYRATGKFSGFTGYSVVDLTWKWHDPVDWNLGGMPWINGQWQLDRQTVLAESILLPSWRVGVGSWFSPRWLKGWNLSPVLEFGRREIAIYQPLSTIKAIRTNTTRTVVSLGAAGVWEFKPFLNFDTAAKLSFQSGGVSGIFPFGGNHYLTNRAGPLKASTGIELSGGATLMLGKRLNLQGKLIYESFTESWTGRFPTASGDPDTHVSYRNIAFEIAAGLKF